MLYVKSYLYLHIFGNTETFVSRTNHIYWLLLFSGQLSVRNVSFTYILSFCTFSFLRAVFYRVHLFIVSLCVCNHQSLPSVQIGLLIVELSMYGRVQLIVLHQNFLLCWDNWWIVSKESPIIDYCDYQCFIQYYLA